jgi:hypothetical protein
LTSAVWSDLAGVIAEFIQLRVVIPTAHHANLLCCVLRVPSPSRQHVPT